MSRKRLVRIISFFSAAVLTVAGFWWRESVREEKLKQMVENQYSSALSELNSNLDLIAVLLEKSMYTTSPSLYSGLAAELYSVAELSKNSLSVLSENGKPAETLNRFLSQVGNYSLSVSQKLIRGEEIDEEQHRETEILCQAAEKIRTVFSDCNLQYNSSENWAQQLESKLKDTVPNESLADSLLSLEENLSDYPTLIYDGPFSDHILTRQPTVISSMSTVSRETALSYASDFCGVSEKEISYSGMEDGKITAYRFQSNNLTVTVSQKGGEIIYFRKNRNIKKHLLSEEDAVKRAENFLEKNGKEKMQKTYYFTDEGVCVINFAYLDGQTLCYPDLIKVGIALDNGEPVFYESTGFLFNHTARAFEVPEKTAAEASAVLSPMLQLESSSIVLIPTDGGGEKRCYEFLCKGREEKDFLVYVDVMTGEEEQILLLLHSDYGILTR